MIFYEGNNVHSDFQEYYSTSINAVLVDSPSMRQSATRLRYKQDGYIYRFDIPLPVILDEDKSEYQLFRSFEAGDSVWKNSFSDTINIRSKGKIYTIIGNATWSEKRTISD